MCLDRDWPKAYRNESRIKIRTKPFERPLFFFFFLAATEEFLRSRVAKLSFSQPKEKRARITLTVCCTHVFFSLLRGKKTLARRVPDTAISSWFSSVRRLFGPVCSLSPVRANCRRSTRLIEEETRKETASRGSSLCFFLCDVFFCIARVRTLRSCARDRWRSGWRLGRVSRWNRQGPAYIPIYPPVTGADGQDRARGPPTLLVRSCHLTGGAPLSIVSSPFFGASTYLSYLSFLVSLCHLSSLFLFLLHRVSASLLSRFDRGLRSLAQLARPIPSFFSAPSSKTSRDLRVRQRIRIADPVGSRLSWTRFDGEKWFFSFF